MKNEAALALLAFLVAPFVAASRGDGGASSRPAQAGDAASRPASAPAGGAAARLADANREIAALREMQRSLERGDPVNVDALRKHLPSSVEGAEAERKTKAVRRRLEELENDWASARVARDHAVTSAQQRVLARQRVGPPIPEEPFPLPLAEPDELRLGKLLLERGEYERAAGVLSRATGAEARYFEARALDGANRVDEALSAYKQAVEAAKGDDRLLSTLERAKRALDWKIQFGRPEDLGAPLKPRGNARGTP